MRRPSQETDVRLLAYRTLLGRRKGEFAEVALARLLQRKLLEERERRLLFELVYGTIRRQKSLDFLLRRASGRNLRQIPRNLLLLLRLGTYQLLFLSRVPAYAILNETVKIARTQIGSPAARFTNAVLRKISKIQGKVEKEQEASARSIPLEDGTWRVLEEDALPDPRRSEVDYLALAYSYPQWAVKRWLSRFGKKVTRKILQEGNRPRPTFLRVNSLKISPKDFLKRMGQEGIKVQETRFDKILRLSGAIGGEPMKAHEEGLFQVQDITQYRIGLEVLREGGKRFLDLCSAPGGKCTQIAEETGDRSQIVAVDNDRARLKHLEENCRRLGIRSVSTLLADVRRLPEDFRCSFERVLLDVPCSNSGTLSRRVEARWRLSEKSLHNLVKSQKELLRAAWGTVSEKGVLVYCTCSIEAEENEKQIQTLAKEGGSGVKITRQELILPGSLEGDGGFFAVLEKV